MLGKAAKPASVIKEQAERLQVLPQQLAFNVPMPTSFNLNAADNSPTPYSIAQPSGYAAISTTTPGKKKPAQLATIQPKVNTIGPGDLPPACASDPQHITRRLRLDAMAASPGGNKASLLSNGYTGTLHDSSPHQSSPRTLYKAGLQTDKQSLRSSVYSFNHDARRSPQKKSDGRHQHAKHLENADLAALAVEGHGHPDNPPVLYRPEVRTTAFPDDHVHIRLQALGDHQPQIQPRIQ